MKEKHFDARTTGKRILSVIILLVIIISPISSQPAQAASSSGNSVATFDALKTAIDEFNCGTQDMTINIGASFTLLESLTITKENATLTIKSTAGATAPFVLTRGFNGSSSSGGLFMLNRSTRLVLENIIIDGNKNSYDNSALRLLYINGGTLTMGSNAVLRNNNGGGVNVSDNSTFIMNGGIISGNTATFFGGGVFVNGGTFTMTAGEISGNETSSSAANSSRYGAGGGGVYVRDGTFTLRGGKINGNSALAYASSQSGFSAGGGVSVINSTFVMNGGEISGNNGKTDGGGVYLDAGAFTMSGGEISGNTSLDGGGVYVYRNTSSFTMTGGRIVGNTASLGGGGGVYIAVNISSGGSNAYVLTLGGSSVIANNAKANGSASNIYLLSGTYITLGTGAAAPGTGMNAGVSTATAGGVIVESGASAAHAAFFQADESGKAVTHSAGQLKIVDASTVQPIIPPTTATGNAPGLDTASSWARGFINEAYATGLIPDALQSEYTQATTRAEFCALAVALYETATGTVITERNTFGDTTDINVEKMAGLGVVDGVGNNMFSPDSALTREQAATMISRLADAIGTPLSGQAATFSDNADVASWAIVAVGQMQSTGIMGGMGNNTFAPKSDYTREQSITTMLRLFIIVQ